MEQNNKIDLNLTDSQSLKIARYFKTNSTDAASQNKVIEKLLIKQAKKQGLSDEMINCIHSATASIDFSLSKSQLIYSVKSASALNEKINNTKDKINDRLEQQEKQGKNPTSNPEKQKQKPYKLRLDGEVFDHVCQAPKSAQKFVLRQELAKQLVAQGYDENLLDQNVNTVEHKNGSQDKVKNFSPPKKLIDVAHDSIQQDIENMKNVPMTPETMLDIAANPLNQDDAELKSFILCKLREMDEEQFRDMAHRPEMINFLGKDVCQAVEDSKKKDLAAESVYESGKQIEEDLKNKEKDDEKDPAASLTDADKEIMLMLGITDPKVFLSMSPEDINSMMREFALTKDDNN